MSSSRSCRWSLTLCALLALSAACSGTRKPRPSGGDGDDVSGGASDDDGGRDDGKGDAGSGDGDGDGKADAGGPYSCSPTSCEAEGASCGRLDDGCGGTLSCGACEARWPP